MARRVPVLLAGFIAVGLIGCSGGASDVEYTRQRAIEQDITATHNVGPTSSQPGMQVNVGSSEPIGVQPWLLDRAH